MKIFLLETKTLDFQALLNMIPNRPEPIGDGEAEKYPLHTQRFSAIAEHIINNYGGDFRVYAEATGTFDDRELDIVDNFDYAKVKPLDLTQTERGLKVRDGRHRCIIIAVSVLTERFAYQSVKGEITDVANCVEVSDFQGFFPDWVAKFEGDPDYDANLWIHFDVDELHNRDLTDTMERYKSSIETMLEGIPADIQNRIKPLKVVCCCHKISGYSERFYIGDVDDV